ncbi:(dimethylallyl)adenosine tRNA methylthiotransferase (plasmid) [Agrobacterium fabrum]|uniref:Adenylate dimethylallyltransferase n=1 Tax=Rhizobium rhizogenes TaxID=359 RepID=IPT_RHIRH|nr:MULTISPECIES: (dimethylallyl)adenosine tRNA methylthiotransferase [Rhizobium/Agrobacterium group]P14011.1 RecName: Full=Adenylate dimethylallyltransferase; AltName: Full=Dimethylallyl transferase; AltName: Full=Isopentenyl transferase; AltName: Full=Trans-zeatin producing protein [Rhizobium rhizogenes]KEA04483.1 isopentenyl transferase [Rhizobium rhizogenes]NMV72384.1 (dimethylallyl)adenosine tRNA methylthiotransferase [Agrobacterium fabrum]NTI85330.1 (dimethylallyl)adenosine tRNA methylthio
MLLYLIYGPTCSGKTDIAIQIAQKTGWPVVALDRVQCCPQIATGSGRPLPSELQSTRRIYLDSRRLTKGIIDAEGAHRRLILEVDWQESEEGLILEGGSVSLLNCMAKSPYWKSGFQWHVKRLRLGDSDAFLARAKQRVTEMFAIREDRPSLLEELAELWNYPATRPILEDIDGYRCAIRFARKHDLAINQLPDIDAERQQDLIEAIAKEYLEHAIMQERDFPQWPEDGARQPVGPATLMRIQ